MKITKNSYASNELQKPKYVSTWIITILMTLSSFGAIFSIYDAASKNVDEVAGYFMIGLFVISLLFSLLAQRNFVIGFLGGLLFLLSGWRIGGPLGIGVVIWPAAMATAVYVLQFLDVAMNDCRRGKDAAMSTVQWHLTFIRIYVAFDMVPHFVEKLFNGPASFQHIVDILGSKYGVAGAAPFVVFGGLCELAVAFGLGAGFLSRVAATGGALFVFLAATVVGDHFYRGFTWNSGGWEYIMLMVVLYFGYAFTGSGRFSIDYELARAKILPRALWRLGLGPRTRVELNG